MKKIVFLIAFILTLNMFAAYNIGDTVLEADNLSWTDNYGYSTSVFNEIENENKVVVMSWGQFG